mmetsp:Transcript_6080/g.23649  ORF Transcript_6080/g.23649 Transcript_6080/m.23649 type:complete len:98 (-) Transcript_6080:968-1261(-)
MHLGEMPWRERLFAVQDTAGVAYVFSRWVPLVRLFTMAPLAKEAFAPPCRAFVAAFATLAPVPLVGVLFIISMEPFFLDACSPPFPFPRTPWRTWRT